MKSFEVRATAENIANEVESTLKEFKFAEITGATRDGAANVEKACEILNLKR